MFEDVRNRLATLDEVLNAKAYEEAIEMDKSSGFDPAS